MTDLTIIITSYNSQFWLKKTLETLKTHYLDITKRKVEVLVIDNDSQDDTTKIVKDQFKWAKIKELEENHGYSVANNIGLKQAQSKYVMLLNPDIEFTENSNLDLLLDLFELDKDLAVVTPKVTLPNGKLDMACHRGEPTLWASFTYMIGLEKLFPRNRLFAQYHQTYKDLSTAHYIDACSGAAMIIKKSAIDKVGLLDERFFMYAEDLDWCHRFREAGFKILYHPQVELTHHKYKSGFASQSKTIAHKTSKHFYDTMLQYYDKYYQDKYPKFVRKIVKFVLTIKKGVL